MPTVINDPDYIVTIKRKLSEIMTRNPNAHIIAMDGMEAVYCEELKHQFKDRIISGGIQEQNALSMATGLAITGKTVYVIMLGMYAFSRAFDQFKLDVGYNNAHITIIAHGSGLWGAPGGYSHWGIEDIALLNTISNLQVVSPLLQEEFEYFMDYSEQTSSPLFIRIDSYGYWHANLYKNIPKPTFGKLSTYKKGKDLILLTYGSGLDYVKMLEDKLRNIGRFEIVMATTLRPFDERGLLGLIGQNKPIISIGEHSSGGLEAIISKVIVKSGKKVKYYPIYINRDNYAFAGNRYYYFEQLSDFKCLPDIILKLLSKSYLFGLFKIKHYFPKKNTCRLRTTIKLCGLPILLIKHKPNKKKYYLFGLIPIYKKKIKD